MSFLLITGATADPTWQAILAVTLPHNEAWARQYGGRVEVVELANGDRPASWDKLNHMARLAGPEPIAWVDADAALPLGLNTTGVLPHCENVFRLTRDANGANCGVMSFPRAAWVGDFLRHWHGAAEGNEIHHPWWEQATMHRLLRTADVVRRLGPWIAAEWYLHAAGVPGGLKQEWLQHRL